MSHDVSAKVATEMEKTETEAIQIIYSHLTQSKADIVAGRVQAANSVFAEIIAELGSCGESKK